MSAVLATFLKEHNFNTWESASGKGTLAVADDNTVKFQDEAGQEVAAENVAISNGSLKDSFNAVSALVAAAEELNSGSIVDRAVFGAKLKSIDGHFALRTFVLGYSLSSLDDFLFSALEKTFAANASFLVQLNQAPFLKRWHKTVKRIKDAAAGASGSSSVAPVEAVKEKREVSGIEKIVGHLQKIPELTNIDPSGFVCTRFPPEPSGFLHVGHVKAALLNAYYAKHYGGKLLIRFDDTNPTKEKDEYVESILADLGRLGIDTSIVSYTSDFFDRIFEYADQMLKEGKAYIDMTPSEELRRMRMEGIECIYRSQPIEENLRLFEEMKKGSELGQQCLMRAKIDMSAKNKVLRDPGLFRCVVGTPHLRTGDKYKAYPLYDFACPIVDALEGVTHAFRSSEYHDRNVLYYWILEALGLRRVWIEDFSRLNFSYTLLSKRKLQWFVDNKIVEGWDSPAFPTFQGITRRGLELEVLKTFIMAQGASKAITLMDINKLWALNRKYLDPLVPRLTAISKASVPLRLSNVPADVTSRLVPRHKKNDALGTKTVFFSSELIIEQADANSFAQDEEITLMDWGNCIIRSLQRDDQNNVTSIDAELHLDGDVRATSKKITWLSASAEHRLALVPVTVADYAFVITKKSLEPGEDWTAFISNPLVKNYEVLADSNLKTMKQGDKLQFERRGYFIIDKVGNDETPYTLIAIPEGRTKGMSSV